MESLARCSGQDAGNEVAPRSKKSIVYNVSKRRRRRAQLDEPCCMANLTYSAKPFANSGLMLRSTSLKSLRSWFSTYSEASFAFQVLSRCQHGPQGS